jgi:hypothetical protein
VTAVFVFETKSGDEPSRLMASTTKTSLSSGDRLRSDCDCTKVFGAVSVTAKPIAMFELVAFRPVGMSFPGKRTIYSVRTCSEYVDNG